MKSSYSDRIQKKREQLDKLYEQISKKESLVKDLEEDIEKLNTMQYKKWYEKLQREITKNIKSINLDVITSDDVVFFLKDLTRQRTENAEPQKVEETSPTVKAEEQPKAETQSENQPKPKEPVKSENLQEEKNVSEAAWTAPETF